MRIAISLLRKRRPLGQDISYTVALCAWAISLASQAVAQPFNNAPPAPALVVPGGQQNGVLFGPNAARSGAGGSANADFESLIDLIQSTVATETWAENGGGEAEVRPFPGGVLVDATGTLRLKLHARVAESLRDSKMAVSERLPHVSAATPDLIRKRGVVPDEAALATGVARRSSALRYVSLPRLEREIVRRQAAHEPLEPAMLTLAGLQRVRYMFVYPDSGDVVLAGPAGDWQVDADGRIVSTVDGQPVVRLDDLLAVLRRGSELGDSHFGCSINPRQNALAKTQAFLASSKQQPLQPGQRKQWLGELRDTVGRQDIEIFGIDPASRVASVLVEADYHMKLVGMGLAEGVDGVESYLDSIKVASERAGASSPPSMSVLRWWFTLNYESILAASAGDAFELVGQGVRVLSENELLAEQGRRVHTGRSDPLNRQFAEAFTAHFNELAAKYPVYGELRNIFDLAMAVALIQNEGLIERAGWQPGILASGEQLRLPERPVPREVETVVNHRVVKGRHIVAGVSGGVMVAPSDVVREVRKSAGENLSIVRFAAPPKLASEAWWWDAE